MSDPFHVVVHAAPAELPQTSPVELQGVTLQRLECQNVQTEFASSFELAQSRFDAVPRMFLEPDGSFVWVTESGGQQFQIDGLLVDNGSNLLNVELKGTANQDVLDQFLTTLGWPGQRLIFQLVAHGVFLDEPEFRRVYID